MLYIGVDLGTSAVEPLLMDSAGTVQKIASREYPLSLPADRLVGANPLTGMSRRLPVLHRRHLTAPQSGSRHQLRRTDARSGHIGCRGPGHLSAILWNDGRSTAQTDYSNQTIGKQRIVRIYGKHRLCRLHCAQNPVDEGKRMQNFARICKIMLPKII